MAIGKNIIANFVGRIWNVVSITIFVPIYINILGVESYGVITFYTMLLTIMAFADAGLAATLNREFARECLQIPAYKQNLLRTFELIYVGIIIVIIGGISLGAECIVRNFIRTEAIPFQDLVYYVRIMGGTIAFYLITSLYNGGFIGLQRQVFSNFLIISYSIMRSGVVIIPLIWAPSLDFYFYWQLIVTIIYAIVLRYFLYLSVRVKGEVIVAKIKYLKYVWRYALGMMFMAIIYSINTQIDKLSVGKLLSLTLFTYYSLSSMIAQGILIVATPIAIAFFPELTRIISQNDHFGSISFYHKFAYIITSLSSAVTTVLIFYAYDYITIWTNSVDIAQSITVTTILLALGAMLMSIQLCPYYLALANGDTKVNVSMGILTITCVTPSLYWLIPKFGLIGAAIPWVVINFVAMNVLGIIVVRKYMSGEYLRWLFIDVLLPIFISFCVGGILYSLSTFLPSGVYTIIYGLVIILVVTVINGYIFYRQYPEILQHSIFIRLFKL